MKTVSREFVRGLVDFTPSQEIGSAAFGEMQLDGAVAAHNMLARNRIAYLADEVGMGKTYVALGVMGLIRYMNPLARIVVIAPRENIQRKWIKELSNFIRLNWRVVGNRVKSLQGDSVWEPVLCNALRDFMTEVSLNANRDFFLRMTSFSLSMKDAKARQSLRKEFKRMVPWADNDGLAARTVEGFRDAYGCSLNAVIPPVDLLVVDEAHNLKHGFGPRVSTRNRILGLGFGRPGGGPGYEWYDRRPQHVLLLSATPFEEDYGAIYRQFDVLGFGGVEVRDAHGRDPVALKDLADPEVRELEKRKIVARLMLRRVAGLQIADSLYTKNMYRREWRSGGLDSHDDPVSLERPEQRLIVALMQKKVAEVLQHERFNNSFQIGMLSSFESFLESLGRMQRKPRKEETPDEEDASSFGGQQDATTEEKRGIDTDAISGIVQSYRDRFGKSLPHPKLDTTAETLKTVFETGDKALVFVRRVATVEELAAKLDSSFDRWIRTRMHELLPGLHAEIDAVFVAYERERAKRPEDELHPSSKSEELDEDAPVQERGFLDDSDEGGSETFFSWFFRGAGPANVLSGAAFQKNRLSAASSAYATLFEDDHVSWLLGRPEDVIGALADAVGRARTQLVHELRRRAYDHFRGRTQQQEGYPRLYVFQAYQAVALEMLEVASTRFGEKAGIVIRERYPEAASEGADPPRGFPPPEDSLGLDTLFTELVKRPRLRERLWPDDPTLEFRERFRRREQRRELISGLARLGAPYIDLYALAMRPLGSFELRRQTELAFPDGRLARDYADLLEKQMTSPGYHSFSELAGAADAFDLLIAVNFPEVPKSPLKDAARIYGATLQRQVPVGRMSGGVNKRLVRQFRMPGFPLVLVTTDVLQEGEDLHTFCKRVVHYGITWTPSAMEQRTGRIDRIGGLAQRQLDGRREVPLPHEWIQVHYPHLQDTVEVLQIRRVFSRMNRFLRLIHKTDGWDDEQDSRIDARHEFLEEWQDVAPINTPLESAFPVRGEWLAGEVQPGAFRPPDLEPYLSHFDQLWCELLRRLPIESQGRFEARTRGGTLDLSALSAGSRRRRSGLHGTQRLELELRSQAAGDATLLRCTSVVGEINPNDPAVIDQLYDAQQALDIPKVCTRPNARTRLAEVSLQGGILFHPETTQIEELESLVVRTAVAAAGVDASLGDLESEIPKPRQRSRGRVPEATRTYLDDLIRRRELPWVRTGDAIEVDLSKTGRRQRVQIQESGGSYIFRSLVAGSAQVRSSDKYWRDLAYRAWCRNAQKDLVTFGFDQKDRLIGLIRQPIDTTDDEELILYIDALAVECDRLEYVVTGEDAN